MLVCKNRRTNEQIVHHSKWRLRMFFFPRFALCSLMPLLCVHSSVSICARGSLFESQFFGLFFSLAKEIVQLTTCNENISFFIRYSIALVSCHFSFSTFLLHFIYVQWVDFSTPNRFIHAIVASIVPQFIGTMQDAFVLLQCYHAVNLPHPNRYSVSPSIVIVIVDDVAQSPQCYNVMPFCIRYLCVETQRSLV